MSDTESVCLYKGVSMRELFLIVLWNMVGRYYLKSKHFQTLG